jgi:hypothetical protein
VLDLVQELCKSGIDGRNVRNHLLDVLLVLVDGNFYVVVAIVGHLKRRGVCKGKWIH